MTGVRRLLQSLQRLRVTLQPVPEPIDTTQQGPECIGCNQQQGNQFEQRFKRDGEYQPAMAAAKRGMSSTKQQGEEGENDAEAGCRPIGRDAIIQHGQRVGQCLNLDRDQRQADKQH